VIDKIRNVFKIPELRKRILFTLGILVVYRIGGHVPTPGVDASVLAGYFTQAQGTLFGFFDMFVGGAFQRATIFALGIMPYISASIILQLLGSVVPYLQKLQKEGEEGRKKITQYTRYGTVLLSAMQAYGISVFLESINLNGIPAVATGGMGFRLMTMLTLTSGTIFIMWLGEQITERGIGNGISLIIMIGIVARYPVEFYSEAQLVLQGQRSLFSTLFLITLMVLVTAAVVLVTRAQRKVPVQYAKRVVGRKMYGGQATHLPLSVNTAGVIPIIFAQSILFAPATLGTFFPNSALMQEVTSWFRAGEPVYVITYTLLIVFFAYFYTAIVFNPNDLAENMQKHGGFVPGIRPGRKTAEYIDRILTRITLPGAVFFAFIAVLPDILIRTMNFQIYFGGTGLLIVVGVALDTLQQVESHLLMRHYDGFMKSGRIRGRR
jgi:preprotein translocase subunit SecY